MNIEKEIARHDMVMSKINNSLKKEDVPDITAANLSSFLAGFVEYDGVKISAKNYNSLYKAIVDYGYFLNPTVKDLFIGILRVNYPERSEKEYISKYIEVAGNLKFNNIIKEINARYFKLAQFKEIEDFNDYVEVMKNINNCFDIKKLPKVSKAVIASFISHYTKTVYSDRIRNEYLYGIVDLLVSGYELTSVEVEKELLGVIEKFNCENINEIFDEILSNLLVDKRLGYLVKEVRAKEKRIMFIYKNDHDLVMEQISDARRISQLPKGYSLSTITGYLSNNSMIYPKGIIIPSLEFCNIANLLVKGKKIKDNEILDELLRIVLNYYPDNVKEAMSLLVLKLSNLPKIYYVSEEVREVLKKQEEFTVRGASNVNVYFIPNPKSPLEGGKFYNCYISRAKNLNLEDILPLNLDTIVPPSMDIDSIEWYIQEHYDPTFKTAGGIILNKDETIGKVTVFSPSDGRIGITQEEKNKYEELEDLSCLVKEVILKKKKETDEFVKMQQEFLLHQQEMNNELSILEEKISKLIKKKKRN